MDADHLLEATRSWINAKRLELDVRAEQRLRRLSPKHVEA